MPIIAQAAELEDFDVVHGSWAYLTSSDSGYRSGYSRGAVSLAAVGSGSHVEKLFDASKTTAGMTIRMGKSSWNWNTDVFFAFTNGSVPVLGLASTTTTGKLQLVSWNGASYDQLAESSVALANDKTRFDIYLENYGAGDATERCRVWVTYLSGYAPPELVIDYSGDLTSPAVSDVDGAYIQGTKMTQGSTASENSFSEFVAADEPTLRMQLVTIYPDAAGDTNTWTGAYTDVDERDANTSDFVESDTAGQVFLANCTTLPAGVTLTPLSVQVTALAALGATGPTQIDVGIKSGGTESWGSDIPLGPAYAGCRRFMPTTNPATTAAWTASDIPSLQIGTKSVT